MDANRKRLEKMAPLRSGSLEQLIFALVRHVWLKYYSISFDENKLNGKVNKVYCSICHLNQFYRIQQANVFKKRLYQEKQIILH